MRSIRLPKEVYQFHLKGKVETENEAGFPLYLTARTPAPLAAARSTGSAPAGL
ncbi:MAG: hypothetical protein JJE04_02305 [Acidobacteriia bacterium]|nr:hypothetical protein [Terriglobia bacterium]